MRLILSISSDIGTAIALNWLDSNKSVTGTYRTWSTNCDVLLSRGAQLIHCDLADPTSMTNAIGEICKLEPWEVLLLAPGDQNPIGLFSDSNFDSWEKSIRVNFLKPLEFMHGILHKKSISLSNLATVIMFAGGGTNSATSHYSAYTVSKIASIKMIELLDYEIADCKFSIIGPGWVESKIHDATIAAGNRAGINFEKTRKMREEKLMNSIEFTITACNWVIDQQKNIVGGRNFSAVHDDLFAVDLKSKLAEDFNFFKLRRSGNGMYER